MSGGIDDDYKWALGRLVMEVSNLDSALTQLIAALRGLLRSGDGLS
jgi:hypothetical protein